jgi:hypothetical protein
MAHSRLLKFFAALVALQILLALPGLFWPEYLDSPIGLVLVMPFLSVYLFHTLGVPGLLQHNGLCGWGWCAPTILGWFLIGAVWLVCTLGIAWCFSKAFPGAHSKDDVP